MYKVVLTSNDFTELIAVIDPWKEGEGTFYSPPADRAVAYIREHSSENLMLGDVAKTLNFSQFYVSKMLHKETGMTFPDILMKERVEKAKLELLKPKLTISEVGRNVGYRDVAHFSRAFKKVTGMTASEWRKAKGVSKRTDNLLDIMKMGDGATGSARK